ncbi:copper chaperone CopZ [Siminovitchia terrae]|uniref:Copper chaperone CopZ n=1 Tax=Siminovitchia terrae TaxID=1914933 RepID=A0A429X6S8_SIMTE|nr:copper chaperone CopZ [Siminovitchia terrae]RST59147.1 copper chaperone [Siminovitchia terrae]GIN90293.1 copper chaperone CopZ [Siminovitchia terrae]GIN94197.1 copper chaperone CopZ [Siminovitchia terrae]
MQETVLKVEGMTCGHCKQSVEKALTVLTGVEKAEVDLAQGTVKVSYNPSETDTDKMKEAVEDQGYDVRV